MHVYAFSLFSSKVGTTAGLCAQKEVPVHARSRALRKPDCTSQDRLELCMRKYGQGGIHLSQSQQWHKKFVRPSSNHTQNQSKLRSKQLRKEAKNTQKRHHPMKKQW